MPRTDSNRLGQYLKDRRQQSDPTRLGFEPGPRRTPGLRREEVAQRAKVSPTWYTWLEQGRGGQPSADALGRIAAALDLSAAERDHLFVLAERRAPAETSYKSPTTISTGLRRVLDLLEVSPALVKTAASDLVAWNAAASRVFGDFSVMAPHERNLLRMHFMNERLKARMPDWKNDVRVAVARFRLEAARVGASGRIAEVVEGLSRDSAEFRALWEGSDVSSHGEGRKVIEHETAGAIALGYAAFIVDGKPDLTMIVYSPMTAADEVRVRSLLDGLTASVSGRVSRVMA